MRRGSSDMSEPDKKLRDEPVSLAELAARALVESEPSNVATLMGVRTYQSVRSWLASRPRLNRGA
jgi:hypothetical protein